MNSAAVSKLASWGLDVKTGYDIGANIGEWTQQVKPLWPGAHIVQIDAKARPNVDIVAVLGAPDITRNFYTIKQGYDTGDSLYLENSPAFHPNNYHATTVTTKSLDQIVEQHNLQWPDFVKLDVQGAELEILKHAPKVMSHVQHLLVELSILPWNHGAPLMAECLAWLHTQHFVVLDILDTHTINGKTAQVDVLLTRQIKLLSRNLDRV